MQVVRTVAEDMYDEFPRGDFRILESYMRALRGAQRLIYLENQFLWSPEIVDDAGRQAARPAARRLPSRRRCCPAKANNGQDDTRGQLGVLVEADDGGERFLAATIRSRSGGRDDPLYVHAKVGIVDDRWLTIGSANLNAHSLLNDTEMNVVTDDAELARDTRVRLWAEHLELDPDDGRGRRPVRAGRRALAADRRRAARAPRTRPAADPSAASRCPASRSARAACWARSQGSSTTAEPVSRALCAPFRGAPAVVPSAPTVRSRAAFRRNDAESPSH